MKKFFAKLHLWLALPFGIIVSLLCLSGAILVFESELKEWTQPSHYKASADTGNVLPFREIIAKATTQLADTVGISSIQVPADPGKNYRLGVAGERRTSIMVDPYTGDVKGVIRPYEKGSFFTFVRRFHRWFLMEVKRDGVSWGKTITGVTTLVFVFVLISGIVIWIPRTWKGLKKRLSVKTDATRFRFWYDFHLSLGKMASLFLLVMALTGLTWSFTWYRNGFYKVFGVETTQPQAGGATQPGTGHGTQSGDGNNTAKAGGPDRDTEEPGNRGQRSGGEHRSGNKTEGRGERLSEADEAAASGEENRGKGSRVSGSSESLEGRRKRGDSAPVNYDVWEKAVSALKDSNPRFRAITVQAASVSVASKRYGNTRASDSYTFNPRSGEITGVSYYKDQPKSAKMRGWIYAVHVGSWGGVYTKVLYFIACLIGTALPVTGYYIWLKKRWKKWNLKR